jgi:cold shock CspA family protein
MIRGQLRCFFIDRGYGFVESDELDRAVFLHASDLERGGISRIVVGDEVEFLVEEDVQTKKRRAVDLKLLNRSEAL